MKTVLFFIGIFAASISFGKTIILDNEISLAEKKSATKVGIQWALSAKEVQAENNKMQQGLKLNPHSFKMISQQGKVTLTLPDNAKYFRVLAWSKSESEPDLLTNWVNIVPDKTYMIDAEHLMPAVLIFGMGC